MGIRGELVTLPPPLVNVTTISSIMRIIILLGCCLLSVWAQKCPQDSVNVKQFYKYTVTEKKNGKIKPVSDAPCWFDLTRNNCGRCKIRENSVVPPCRSGARTPRAKMDVKEFLVTSTHCPQLEHHATGTHHPRTVPGARARP